MIYTISITKKENGEVREITRNYSIDFFKITEQDIGANILEMWSRVEDDTAEETFGSHPDELAEVIPDKYQNLNPADDIYDHEEEDYLEDCEQSEEEARRM